MCRPVVFDAVVGLYVMVGADIIIIVVGNVNSCAFDGIQY